ncbi:ABC-three component system protein [Acinetobacter guillouiae]|uniref:ABC-three component system protein n=1 Tax=Acinetobacter guillouiae TaxID=106649 RepID=UPI002FD99906
MSDIFDEMKEHTVIVCDGSGVLIQPISEDYSYILTAKHVLKSACENGREQECRTRCVCNKYLQAADIKVEKYNGEIINIVDSIIDDVHDIAILKTDGICDSTLVRSIDDIGRDQTVYILGYPKTRRGAIGENRINEYEGTIGRVQDSNFSVNITSKPGHDQVSGASGGGCYKNIEGDVFLCAIEIRMEGNVDTEFHGRVECIPLSIFDQLILRHIESYAQILPPYLNCFSRIIRKSFQFQGLSIPDSTEFLKKLLHEFAENNLSTLPKPFEVYEYYKNSLLIRNAPIDDAFHLKLWITFLEFILICSLVDEEQKLDFSYIQRSSTKRKFLFSATIENWFFLLNDIYTSNLHGLVKDGVIIVSTGKYEGKHTPSQKALEKVISNIGRFHHAHIQIDSPLKNPVRDFKLQHWSGLHDQCVVSEEDFYVECNALTEGFDATAIFEKLRVDYREFIG